MIFEEIKKQAIADFNAKMEQLKDYLMKPVSEYNGDGLLELLSENRESSERDKLFYYLCEAVQMRYCDRELQRYVNPEIIKEKKKLRRRLLDFVHMLEKENDKTQIPKWRRAFEIPSPADRDIYFFDDRTSVLIKIPIGSTTAQCLLLKELDFLPKEEKLWTP